MGVSFFSRNFHHLPITYCFGFYIPNNYK